jgi:peptidoglycan/LPS O-acetylase OafA/YrhL
MQMKPANRSDRIPTLDGWRAVAIILVIVHHAGTGLEGLNEKDYFATSLTRFGVNGVPIFFALSGLLITKLLLDEFDRTGTISMSAFYARRAFRILPPLTAIVVAIAALGLYNSRLELAACLAFFRNYLAAASAGIYTAHIWTLSIEEHFYLFWPCLLLLLLRRKSPFLATVLLAFGIGIWRSVDLHLHLIHRLFPALDTGWRTDYRLDGMLWGCAAAFILHRTGSLSILKRMYPAAAACVAIAAFCVLLIVPVPLSSAWSSMAIALMLLGTVIHPDWILGKVLSLPLVQWFGRISYSLYLWQQIFLLPAWEPHRLPFVQKWPWNLAASLACATVSYYFIEKPMIRMGRRMIVGVRSRDEIAKTRAFAARTEPAEMISGRIDFGLPECQRIVQVLGELFSDFIR